MSLLFFKLMDENNIIFYALMIHTSCKTSHLDLVGFRSVRNELKNTAQECALLYNDKPLDVFDFFSLLCAVYEKV